MMMANADVMVDDEFQPNSLESFSIFMYVPRQSETLQEYIMFNMV